MHSHIKTRLLFFLTLLLAGYSAKAGVVVSGLFSDNAVLQREKPVPIWGRADPGEKLSVSFRGQNKEVVADGLGYWRVILDPMPAAADPTSLTVKGENTVEIHNILVGDVWLCSGQSNMAFPVSRAANAEQEIKAADYPLLRHIAVPRASSAYPCDDIKGGKWDICSPGTAANFSATAYFFGRELRRELKEVPIGLINSSWGGTMIEAWMDAPSLAADPSWQAVLERWQKAFVSYPERLAVELKKAKPRAVDGAFGSRVQPSAIYNGMIAPLVPVAVKGILWYQGEANVHRYTEYRTLFPSMITRWRANMGQGDIPFYYVQLPNFEKWPVWPWQREAQQYALKLPNTAQAVTIDIGEPKEIHPKNKQEVGRRLALIALSRDYGRELEYSGPVCERVAREGKAFRIKLSHARGLHSKTSGIPGFEVAGSDRVFKPASARIEGETLLVSSEEVKDPVAVRYAWAANPAVSLYNAAGLPAAPFRSDDWEGPQ